MPELLEYEDRHAIVAGDICLVFHWTGERWVHWLEHKRYDQKAFRVVASSFESSLEDTDPQRVISPVYQQLQFQKNGEMIQALLVGQSGPHHFSAVFTVEDEWVQGVTGRNPAEPPFEVMIKVDIADRCRGPIEFLASTYTINALSNELDQLSSPGCVGWNFEGDCLSLSPDWPARVTLAEAGRRATQVQAFAVPEPGSATHRLIYDWIWQQNLPLGHPQTTSRNRPTDERT